MHCKTCGSQRSGQKKIMIKDLTNCFASEDKSDHISDFVYDLSLMKAGHLTDIDSGHGSCHVKQN